MTKRVTVTRNSPNAADGWLYKNKLDFLYSSARPLIILNTCIYNLNTSFTLILLKTLQLLIANEEVASPYATYGQNGSIEVH